MLKTSLNKLYHYRLWLLPLLKEKPWPRLLGGMLIALLGFISAEVSWAADPAHASNGFVPPIWTLIPFLGILFSIAVIPLVSMHLWEHHYGKISLLWMAAGFIAMIASVTPQAFLASYGPRLFTIYEEYIAFIVLLGSLFVISGGVHITRDAPATPLVNTITMLIGSVLASLIGTTGAAMLLVRPLLRANEMRRYKVHVVMFFIFLVCNIGGLLTPIGDPPLFLGFLQGIPFEWTLKLFPQWLFTLSVLLAGFFLLDSWLASKESRFALEAHAARTGAAVEMEVEQAGGGLVYRPIGGVAVGIEGFYNVFLLLGVVVAVILSGAVHLPYALDFFGFGEWHLTAILRDVTLVVLGVASLALTPKLIRERNQFNYEPIREVALLFIGIFTCMTPALMLLNARGGELGLESPASYMWVTGILSAFLDNAPTYLAFLATAMGALGLNEAIQMTQAPGPENILKGISIGAVFFGALTYIGNGPNFMVRSIAQSSGVDMPSFFGYMLWSTLALMPIFALVGWIFF